MHAGPCPSLHLLERLSPRGGAGQGQRLLILCLHRFHHQHASLVASWLPRPRRVVAGREDRDRQEVASVIPLHHAGAFLLLLVRAHEAAQVVGLQEGLRHAPVEEVARSALAVGAGELLRVVRQGVAPEQRDEEAVAALLQAVLLGREDDLHVRLRFGGAPDPDLRLCRRTLTEEGDGRVRLLVPAHQPAYRALLDGHAILAAQRPPRPHELLAPVAVDAVLLRGHAPLPPDGPDLLQLEVRIQGQAPVQHRDLPPQHVAERQLAEATLAERVHRGPLL
mmetsp:Transcript_10705/g.30201  ORF Transcript_10705/g.30201 Transcript_10705/m.30201 type:complete len:279 (-) Transcript_10705:804-1640(-)